MNITISRSILIFLFSALLLCGKAYSQSVITYPDYNQIYGTIVGNGQYVVEKRIEVAGYEGGVSRPFIVQAGVEYAVYSGSCVDMLSGFDTETLSNFDAVITSIFPVPYNNLTRERTNSYVITEGDYLRFVYNERYKSSDNLRYSLYDAQYNAIDLPLTIPSVSLGRNFYSLDVSSLNNGELYSLNVISSEGKNLYLNFLKTEEE